MTPPDPDKLTFEDVVFERAPCPLCGADDPSDPLLTGHDRVWRKEGEVTLAACGGCGLVYQCPRPTPETMRYYYEDCYSGEAQEKMRQFQLESGASRVISLYRLVTLEKVQKLEPGQRVLDVGASYGGLIEYIRTERGVEAHAIDLDPGSIEQFVNKDDIDVRCGDLLAEAYPADHFDAVFIMETLEHVYEPVATLAEIRRILKPGGLVSVEVPCWDSPFRPLFGSYWFPLLLPTHLQHFSWDRLAECAERAGLEVAHQQAMVYPGEATVSVALWLSRWLGRPDDPDRGIFSKIIGFFVGLWLVGLFLMEIPMLMFLRVVWRTGHQTMVARKPVAGA